MVCSVMSPTLYLKSQFHLDDRKLDMQEIKLIGTHPSLRKFIISPNGSIQETEAVKTKQISDSHTSPPNEPTMQKIVEFNEKDSWFMEDVNDFSLCLNESIENGVTESDPQFFSTKTSESDVLIRNLESQSVPNINEFGISLTNSLASLPSTRYYKITRVDCDTEMSRLTKFLQTSGMELIELNSRYVKLCDLDLRYLSDFQFTEKFLVKLNFQLHNSEKRFREYQVEENPKKFNNLCRKLTMFNKNFKRKVVQTEKNQAKIIPCNNCGSYVDFKRSKTCPMCLSILMTPLNSPIGRNI
ncbi:hypothetical protein RF11_05694 [Thelohanellus kitauei]|uniref:Uncharacterized protein n=1 Tax=Thelohanellus kitauei TaxID=669202 RepID=A0A0C2N156_THEKT|nr:hypothetical protein RF11_05694 [Thelohanellus kitauei]